MPTTRFFVVFKADLCVKRLRPVARSRSGFYYFGHLCAREPLLNGFFNIFNCVRHRRKRRISGHTVTIVYARLKHE